MTGRSGPQLRRQGEVGRKCFYVEASPSSRGSDDFCSLGGGDVLCHVDDGIHGDLGWPGPKLEGEIGDGETERDNRAWDSEL